MNIDYVDAAEI